MQVRDEINILYELLCCDPDIVVCISCITNACLHESWEITKNGRPFNENMKQRLQQVYDVFMRDCVRMIFLCGFAAFYVQRVNKVPLLFYPAIGRAIVSECRKTGANTVYEIRVTKGSVKDSELHIMNYYSQIVSLNIRTLMQAILAQYMALQEIHQTIRVSNKWNQEKHIVIT